MYVAGLDFSTKALDVVLLDDDTESWIWKTFPIHGRTPFDRAQDIRFTLPTTTWWEERNVRLIAVEEPRGHQNAVTQLALGSLYGAIVARLPRSIPACAYTPSEWKRPFTGNGNAPKELVRRCALEHGLPDDMPQDAYDAYGIAWTARALESARNAA